MSELSTMTLAQIVTGDHKAAAVFEKYNLDFCCRGKRTLEQACDEQKLPVESILRELVSTPSGNACQYRPPFDKFTITQLADYIVAVHHEYVKKEMPSILHYLQKVASKHGDRDPELKTILEIFESVKEEMEQHMEKEELVLFPRMKELQKLATEQHGEFKVNLSYLISPITIMQQEHDHAGAMLSEIRKLSNNYEPPSNACTTYRVAYAALRAFELDLHQHVHLENNILFPKSIELFRTYNNVPLN